MEAESKSLQIEPGDHLVKGQILACTPEISCQYPLISLTVEIMLNGKKTLEIVTAPLSRKEYRSYQIPQLIEQLKSLLAVKDQQVTLSDVVQSFNRLNFFNELQLDVMNNRRFLPFKEGVYPLDFKLLLGGKRAKPREPTNSR